MTRHGELLERLDAAGVLELGFLQHRATGTVHVLVPSEPAWMETGEPTPVTVDEVIAAAAGVVWALCGYRGRRHLGGFEQGDQVVTVFVDTLLCGACHRGLGKYAARAFEHEQPPQV